MEDSWLAAKRWIRKNLFRFDPFKSVKHQFAKFFRGKLLFLLQYQQRNIIKHFLFTHKLTYIVNDGLLNLEDQVRIINPQKLLEVDQNENHSPIWLRR